MSRGLRCGLAALLLFLATHGYAALPPQLPPGLVWKTNQEDPVFASPEATRGGRFRTFIDSFPLTLRLVGPDSNGSFAGFMRANNLALTDIHPNTLNPIPQLASHWAFRGDGKTVFYKLDPTARWSDGKPVTAADYIYTLKFMRSSFIVAPWYNNYYTEMIVDVAAYDDYTIGIEGSIAKPEEDQLYEYGLSPTPAHFHQLDENWVRDYNWKIEPVTGPYSICEIRKGKYIEFCRQQDWWGDDKRYFRNRYNVDQVRVKVIRDLNIAYQYFAKGELDTFPLVMPQLWYRKAQGRLYDLGYVGRVKFYNDRPQPSLGMYLNMDDPLLADRNVRLGIAHAMNIDKVIRTVLRNDYERLQTMNEGYGEYSRTDLRPREFDLEKADQHFRAAGWINRDGSGIRVKDGRRLSVRITYSSPSHTPRLVVLKEEARKAGLELELQQLDSTTAFKQILEKKHQIAWMGWGIGGLSPRYWEGFDSVNAHKPQTNNITNTDDPLMDEKIEAYRVATDRPSRIRLAHELEGMVYDSGAFIPTFKIAYTREGFWRWMKLPPWLGTRSSDALFDPFGTTGGLFWIDEELKRKLSGSRTGASGLAPLLIEDTTWKKN